MMRGERKKWMVSRSKKGEGMSVVKKFKTMMVAGRQDVLLYYK
jgi:hypothetical protein